ncbi:MAG: multifunctional oxoglutarate decarboxylase/oxoglutarate dehydrogenase thiamine pyrophosphate-binding subunit/dihydrolipoyllysine-residue succinyltransferase subunit, partial [Actinobacteria bacterium]
KALAERPSLNAAYRLIDGTPHRVQYRHVNLGLAIDVERKDGTRTLLVPSIKAADGMGFDQFWFAYEDLVRRVRTREVTPDDFAGTTATITNPGTVGTVQSVPRLMPDQGVIIGVGAIQFGPQYEGADPATLAAQGIGRTLTVTSTYDHRIIQGAESGLLLQRVHELLLGEDRFYEEIFESMAIPYVPARWAVDHNPPPGSREWAEKQAMVVRLINNYRVRGHLIADLDPLRQRPPAIHPELDPLTYGLTIWDLDREFATGGIAGRTRMKLGDLLGLIRDAYCRTIGIEYMHIQEPDQKLWIQEHVEAGYGTPSLDEKRRILQKLNEAESFERFLHTKFLGAKRFSLEGSESVIPLLDALLTEAADNGMQQVVIGMAHRGRLNVLANVLGKDMPAIFREFEGGGEEDARFSGDVKYHLGGIGRHLAPSGATLDLEIVANPSHLEAVDPVLEGTVRARQDLLGESAGDLVLPLLVHGDAAFAGQGVVAETFNLSQLEGYHTGGTVHVVIDNQVGFTTTVVDARSSVYATDVAKIVQAPIFHVNGGDPEAVVRVAKLAFYFRQAFHKDVVIDLVVYRRLGHNEGDEPTYTQPRMYRLIEQRPSVRKLYLERLLRGGDMTLEEAEAVLESFQSLLDKAFENARTALPEPRPEPPAEREVAPETAIDPVLVEHIEGTLRRLPADFTPHPKLARILEERARTFTEGTFDWGMAEAFAWGSLAVEGIHVRLAGEDSQRGTFSHRHAVLVDYETEAEYEPLCHLGEGQARVDIYDSMLSEFATMGFEYGYTVADPASLVIWEAQFGDFVNGAQVVIDQFVMTGLDKWQQRSGLTLLLPHGFEGQGPEHSSARLERFLQNAAEDNVRIVVPSTSGQYFHLFRRQALWQKKRPLIVMSPKSLLRTKASHSAVDALSGGHFHPVIPDAAVTAGARRVLLCSGKIFYDLAAHREESGIDDVAIVRIEELYPFPAAEVRAALGPFDGA